MRLCCLCVFGTVVATASAARALPSVLVKAAAPLGEDLADALRQQRPDVSVRTFGDPAPDELIVALSSGADGWTLSVARGDGAVALVRALPPGGELASTCALILDRLLEEPRWSRDGASEVEPVAVPAQASGPDDWTRNQYEISMVAGVAAGFRAVSSSVAFTPSGSFAGASTASRPWGAPSPWQSTAARPWCHARSLSVSALRNSRAEPEGTS